MKCKENISDIKRELLFESHNEYYAVDSSAALVSLLPPKTD